MRKRNAIIGLAIVAVVGGWYAFRPERLFVNKTVNESLGGPIDAGVVASLPLDWSDRTLETRGQPRSQCGHETS